MKGIARKLPISRLFSTYNYFGLEVPKSQTLRDNFLRHRPLLPIGDAQPLVANDAFVAPGATVTGKVGLFESSSVRLF